jgi:hypothetical protein
LVTEIDSVLGREGHQRVAPSRDSESPPGAAVAHAGHTTYVPDSALNNWEAPRTETPPLSCTKDVPLDLRVRKKVVAYFISFGPNLCVSNFVS